MFRLVFILILCCSCGCAGSFTELSKRDYEYQATSTLLTVADWNQTLQFAENNKHENNILLGKTPSDARINTLIPLAIMGQWLTTWALPNKAEAFGIKYNPRRVFQVGVIAGEGWAVNNNYNIGIKVKF